MPYLKAGIVTRIEIDRIKNDLNYLDKFFNLNLFCNGNNVFLLKKNILRENLVSFRKEFMNITNYRGDSLNNCEAYSLEIDVNKMLENEIYLSDDGKKFYFENFENMKFDTDQCYYKDKKISMLIFFIPIFWDINKIVAEDFDIITVTVNNLTRLALKNKLKDACWFAVI